MLSMKEQNLSGILSSEFSKLRHLKILDLSRNIITGSIPQQWTTMNLEELVLRRCMIKGEIPEYIGVMEKLKILDLSFNSLSGKIPDSFDELDKVDFMYLTSNNLSGTIPRWVLSNNKNIDISNNNFEWENSSPTECPRGSINLVESYSLSSSKKSNIHSCFKRNFPCSSDNPRHYSMRINCGGSEANVSGSIYEADTELKGASVLFITNDWALSSTGSFMDNDIDSDPYTVTNTSKLLNVSMINSKLYTTARVSPLSLTYYGLCMINGNYTVKLHFAEIIFINDMSFNRLGKRIFDVYIQDKLVLRDFDIEREAGGTEKPIVKKFNATVTQNTLRIQFYWAGKGTTGIPTRGVYGPLVSAITVDPNFKPPSEHGNRTYVILLTVGIVCGVLVVVLIMLAIMRRKGMLGGKDPVYKDGTVIAVKQLSSKSKQGNREFVNEIGMLSGLQHPNLVKLHGCCVEGNQLILIYEYMENNCLSRILFGKGSDKKKKLDWLTRKKICLGIAKALAYLHEESRIKIIHRDIKASNVLLDKDFNAKISDFGLAKLIEDDKTHVSTRIAGTM
ncbi:hypothetical protein RYX36_005680 [Vicia faba]